VEPIVPRRRPALAVALSLLTIPPLAAPVQGEEYHCRRGDLVRRVEVQFADDADRLPCEVVYWKDTERPGQPQIPWKAENHLDFCTRKAQEMVDSLRGAGWTCGAETPSEDAAQLDAAPPAPRLSHAPAASDRPPGERENGSARPARAILQAALARDIRRLEELSGGDSGRFAPDMTTLGDLDGDGVEDGAVLLSHRDANGGLSHHLLAYLFDGSTFRPVARLNIEAYYQNFTEVAIEGITDRGIELLLHVPRAGDPACCPSGRRHATFELRDGQLILAAESESGA
jgi:hypothetical protein